MDPSDIVIRVFFIVIGVGVVGCLYIAFRSLIFTVSALNAKSVRTVNSGDRSRNERLSRLSTVPFPLFRHPMLHGPILVGELPKGGISEVLNRFEQRIISTNKKDYYLGKLKSLNEPAVSGKEEQSEFYATLIEGMTLGRKVDQERTSMVIISQATLFTRFAGWIEIEDEGYQVRWYLKCSEVRLLVTPFYEASHFNYNNNETQYWGRRGGELGGEDWVLHGVSLLLGIFTSKGNAEKAKSFREFLLEMWTEALNETVGKYPTPEPNTAMAPNSQTAIDLSQPPPQSQIQQESDPKTLLQALLETIPSDQAFKNPRKALVDANKGTTEDHSSHERPQVNNVNDAPRSALLGWVCANCGERNLEGAPMCIACAETRPNA